MSDSRRDDIIATSPDDFSFSEDRYSREGRSPLLIVEDPPAEAKAPLSFWHGLALVLGLQIGSGIFFAPSQVSQHVANPGTAVAVWLVAGVLVWTGAASFVELGVAHPENGGIATYLQASYGDFAGFLFSWIWVLIPKPCSMAMISMIFAENVVRAGWGATLKHDQPSLLLTKSIALLGLWSITLVNCFGSIAGARVANGFLVLKLSAILSIAVLGFVVFPWAGPDASGDTSISWFGQDPDPERQHMGIWLRAGEAVTAVYGALFCYGGWESVSHSRCLFYEKVEEDVDL